MIMSFINRKTVQTAGIFLAVATLATTSSAQLGVGKNPPAKIQGGTIDAAPQPVVAKIGTTAKPAPATASTVTNAPPVETPTPKGGYATVEFDELASFDFDPPSIPATNRVVTADEADKLVPAAIKALDKKKVTVTGFMIPITTEGNNTTEFLIIRNQFGCCFGSPPKLNELVTVKIAGKGVEQQMGQPVTVKGTLHVGTIRDSGDVTGVYRMDGEALVGD